MEEKKKNNMVWLLVVAGVLLVLGGLWISMTGDTPDPAAEPQQLEVVLNEENNSGQSGTATLDFLEDGTTQVTIDAPPGPLSDLAGPQPAHIHTGTCGDDLGGVVYPLEDVVDGYSLTIVDATFETLQSEAHAINIHQSPEQVQVYTACGNI